MRRRRGRCAGRPLCVRDASHRTGDLAVIVRHPLDEDEAARALRRLDAHLGVLLRLEHALERAEVAARVAARRAAREAGADGAEEVGAVVDEEDVPLAHEGGDDRRDRRDAVRVHDGLLGAEELGEPGLELQVAVERAVEAAGAAGAAAVLVERRHRRRARRVGRGHLEEVGRAELEGALRARDGGERRLDRRRRRRRLQRAQRLRRPVGGGLGVRARLEQHIEPLARARVAALLVGGGGRVVEHADLARHLGDLEEGLVDLKGEAVGVRRCGGS